MSEGDIMSDKVAIITGGSSGIGLEIAKCLSEKGVKVYTLSRRDFEGEGLNHVRADVTDRESVKAAVSEIIEREGHIDILINSAGFCISGSIEFTEIEDIKKQFDVNFLGTVIVTQEVLHYMRENGGRIVNVSSMAAPAGIPFQSFYSATKAAINSYTLALRNEVKPFGISVCSVLPGDVKTPITGTRKSNYVGDEEYNGQISKSIKLMCEDEINGMSAVPVGRRIAHIALKKKVKPFYETDILSKAEYVLFRILPNRISNIIVGKVYGC